MNKPIRCTTHFHACDCREYEFEMLQKENEELRKQRDIALNDLASEAKENQEMREDLKYLLKGTKYFRPDMQKYCEEIIARHNLPETPDSSKEGV